MDKVLSDLVGILHREGCSCVILTNGKITIYHERGVKDLFRILKTERELLDGAYVADKVIGKGAAALVVLGKVREVYADVISRPALELLKSYSIPVSYAECVPNIINRAGTGVCPVETLCKDASSAEQCLPLIEDFLANISKQ